MFKIQDFKTIYNMMIASFLILTISLLYDNYLRSGMLLDMLSLKEIFSGVQGVVQVWVLLVGVHFTIIPLTKLALATTIFVWLPLYLVHIFALLWLATDASRAKDIGFGSVFIVMGEAVRMAMKSHSYFRTKLLYLKDNQYKHYSVRGKRVVLVNKKHKPPESEGGQ